MRAFKLNKIIVALFFILIISTAAFAYPLQSFDHMENPAYLSLQYGKWDRKYLETGLSFEVGLGNSYFTLQEVMTPDLVIDLNKIATDLDGKPLDINASFSTELHTVLTVLGVSVGGYGALDGVISAGVPYGVFDVLANGIDLVNQSYSDSGTAYARVFAQSGLYGGFRMKDWQISAKIGSYIPLVYTDENSSYSYSLNADSQANITALLNGDLSVYLPIDVENIDDLDPADLSSQLSNWSGYNLDVGLVKMKDGLPLYGASLTGITLAPAHLDFKTSVNFSGSADVSAIAGYDESTGEDIVDPQFDEPEFDSDEGNYPISLPLRLGGFYRYRVIGILDLIGSAGLTYDKKVLPDIGVTAKGTFFPLNMIYASLNYDKVLWESSAGFRMNIRIMELGMDVGMASPRLSKLFATSGAKVRVYTAFGF